MALLSMVEKIAHNCEQLGLTVTRTGTTAVITNASNALTVSLVAASIQSPMGGVDPTVSPFLGIGTAAPCTIKLKSALNAGGTSIVDVIDGTIALTVFRVCAEFANDVLVENGNASVSVTIRGGNTNIMLGQ